MSLNDYPDFYMKRGDTANSIRATLRDGNGQPVPLTAATVEFHMRDFLTGVVTVNDTADIIAPATDGNVAYDWVDGDTDSAGYFFGEWQVTFSGGEVQTFPSQGYHLIAILEDTDTPNLTEIRFAMVRELRPMIAEPTQDSYTDTLLDAMLLVHDDDLDATAARVWREKMAAYSELVDVNNAGSSRKLSQLYDRAKEQTSIYENRAAEAAAGGGGEEGAVIQFGGGVRTRAIERP